MPQPQHKISVIFCNLISFWGGGEQWHYDHAMYLHGKPEFHVTVIVYPDSELHNRLKKTDVETIPLRATSVTRFLPWRRAHISTILKQVRGDIIIFNNSKELNLLAPISKQVGIPIRVYARALGIAVKQSQKNIDLICHIVTHILVPSRTMKQAFDPFDEIKTLDITEISNGIDVEAYKMKNILSYDSITDDILHIASVGRLVKSKGFNKLIALAEVLKNKNIRFRMSIAGDGPEMNNLLSSIVEKDLENEVELAGFVSDIPHFLEDKHIYIHSSYFEGFGLAIAEAMASGIPVIAWDAGAMNELVRDGETGYLCPIDDVDCLAEKVLLLSENSEMLSKMGQRGREVAEQEYSQEIQMEKVAEFLERIYLEESHS